MIKRIKDLTPKEKARYLESVKKTMIREQGVPWSRIEPKIRASIEETFDDEAFSKMDTEFAIDAAYARNHFKWHEKHEKPNLVDYLLYVGEFVTHSDLVEIPDDPAEAAETGSTASSPASTASPVSAAKSNKSKAKSGKKTQPEKKSRQSKQSKQNSQTSRRRDGMKTIDKIRRIVNWAEETMMPPPGSPWAEIAEFENQLFIATQVIKTYPKSFLTHPEFLKLIELGKKQIADENKYPFRLTASLPVTDLRKTIYGTINVNDSKLKRSLTLTEKRRAETKLRLLPLPVMIECHPEITGTNEEIMVFNWFRCAGPEQAKEVMNLIPKFFLALIEGLDNLPDPDTRSIQTLADSDRHARQHLL